MIVRKFSGFLLSFFFSVSLTAQKTNTQKYISFDDFPVYNGNDLGMTYSIQQTVVKLWSPAAEEVLIHLYKNGADSTPLVSHNMLLGRKGVWSIILKGDWKNKYYTFQIKYKGKWLNEAPDPYAYGVGVNGNKAMIFDKKETNPKGWLLDKKPFLKSYSDIILYEAHVRDVSIAANSGIMHKGKFLGLTESGTKNTAGQSTGLDHFKEMGITHIHLLPSFDFRSIDESILNNTKYNWGYDPKNYNVPEGTYATNAYDGKVRNKEFKAMVQALHKAGIRVVMDVVYNHTSGTAVFDDLVPGYYYRQRADGSYSDASACGNEVASDRPMVRNYIVNSVMYWAKEYHVDGFRFDLMAIHDITTMNIVSTVLRKIDPTIFIYGEGWTAGSSPLPDEQKALKVNVKKLNHVAVFSDDIRDGIKGHWSNVKEKGFASGNVSLKEVVKFGVVASTNHPQIKFDPKRAYAQFPYSDDPTKIIGYVSCHDNNTLYDKLKIANPEATEADLVKMGKLSNSIVFTSQSVPFFMMGEEMKRTKKGVENSYDSPDDINQIDWDWKTTNSELVAYYKSLIQLRKKHPAFKMPTEKMIQQHLRFLNTDDQPLLVGYTLNNHANGDTWKNIAVFYNGDNKDAVFTMPNTSWKIIADGNMINENSKQKINIDKQITIPAYSMVILAQD